MKKLHKLNKKDAMKKFEKFEMCHDLAEIMQEIFDTPRVVIAYKKGNKNYFFSSFSNFEVLEEMFESFRKDAREQKEARLKNK